MTFGHQLDGHRNVAHDGTPQDVKNDQRVIAAYLGVEDEEVRKVEAEVGV